MRNPGDGCADELDARLSETWEAAAAAVGRTLDLQVGREALLSGSELPPGRADGTPVPAPVARGTGRRQRRLVRGSVVGAAVALAAGAVALVAVVPPGSGIHGSGGPGLPATGKSAVTTAYVVRHVDSALKRAGTGEVARVTITTSGRISAREWYYGDRSRSITYLASGKPLDDVGINASSSAYTLVNYQKQVWTRQAQLSGPTPPAGALVPGSGNCKAVLPALSWVFQPRLGIEIPGSSPPASVASALRAAVSCGALTIAGRQYVDGAEAIKLTNRAGSLIPETIWVSPDTYLPVRVTTSLAPLKRTANITWLQPTAQNLAELTVPIPVGFRRVSLSQAVGPVIQRIPGRPPTPG